MTAISDEDLESLAAKLDALELNTAEQAALDGVLERAEAFVPDVEGFGSSGFHYTGESRSGARLSGTSLKLGGGLGFTTRPSLGFEAGMSGDGGFRPPPP